MSGFKDDVISILRQNSILQSEAIGWIVSESNVSMAKELFDDLVKRRFPVTNRREKVVILYDYIILDRYNRDMEKLLRALSSLSEGGILVIEISDLPYRFLEKYTSQVWNFTATKVNYDDRTYIVVHQGVDYGD